LLKAQSPSDERRVSLRQTLQVERATMNIIWYSHKLKNTKNSLTKTLQCMQQTM